MQERSRATIETILEATAQLLEVMSPNSLTTNHIADRAGISIGTLYQYFPNKAGVLTALAERARQDRVEMALDRLSKLDGNSVEDVARQIIQTLIVVYSSSFSNRQLIKLMTIQGMNSPGETAPIDEVATIIAAKLDSLFELPKLQSEIYAFVLTRSVTGVIRSAVMDAPHFLKEQEFEDQLVRLATSLLDVQ